MKAFTLISIYMSALIGAGFASGLEIKTYFADYGTKGLMMIIPTGILFFTASYKMFVMSLESRNGSFAEFCDDNFSFFSPFIKILSLLFMISTLSAMISCGSEITADNFVSRIFSGAVLSLLCFFILKDGDKGLGKISTFLFPLMIFGIISVCMDSLEPKRLFFEGIKKNGFLSPLIYVSYNTITALPLVFSAKNYIYSKKNALFCAVISSIAVTVIMFLCTVCIILRFDDIHSSIPLYDISGSKTIYKIILLSAVITTAVSNLLAISDMLCEISGISAKVLRKYIVFFAFAFSLAGFSSLVNTVYTFFGCIGIFELTVLIFSKKSRT